MKHKIKERRFKMRLKLKNNKIILILILIPCIALILVVSIKSFANASTKANSVLSGERIVYTGEKKELSGVWGNLEESQIIVQAKLDYFNKDNNFNSIVSAMKSSDHWTFKNLSLDNIRSLFLASGISQDVCEQLINNTKPISDSSGYITTPPDEILWNFSSEIRSRLYPVIGQYEGNKTYSVPYQYTSLDPTEWLYKSNLPKDITDKLEKLIYVQGNMCCISDLHLLAPFLKTSSDWNLLLQTVFRTTAVDISLKVQHGQDVNKLLEYWGNLDREKDIKPILEHLRDNPNGGKVNIVDLLPPIPQSRLNTFVSTKESDKYFRDCKWSMFTFFNLKTDDRYTDINTQSKYFSSISTPIQDTSKLKFGDIIMIKDKAGIFQHTCVYIADNIVYTKDGQNSNVTITPFILSDFGKTLTIYSYHKAQVNLEFYQRSLGDTNQIKSIPIN
jgi:hypothetical protein